jgi:hypothetical protein
MKTLTLLIVVVLAGCKDEGKEVLDKLGEYEKAMCACPDEACAKKVRAEHDKYLDRDTKRKPTDKQMSTVMDIEERIDTCEGKFVLNESGTMQLDALKKELADAKEKVTTGKYVEAGFACSKSSLEMFQKNHGAIAASKPEIKTLIDEYTAYCVAGGMHIEAVTAVVTKAEAARATTPTGSIPECSSADMTLAEVKLKDVPGGPEKLAPLKERYAKACPR